MTVIARKTRRPATRQPALTLLRESYAPAAGDPTPDVDWEAGIIKGVKVLGRTSPNTHGVKGVDGTEYSTSAMEAALPLYEGRAVNIDHPPRATPSKDRSSYDRFGKLVNARVTDHGIYADLHFLKTHPMAKRVCEAARKMPDLFGLSHNAYGKGEVRGGKYVIVEIPEVRSVDIVADAGSVTGLFESREQRKPMKIRTLLEAWLPNVKKSRRPILAKLLEECDDDMKKVMEEEMPGDMPADMAAPPEATSDPDQALRDGFRAAMVAVLDDDSMDAKGKLAKLKDLLNTHEKLTAVEEPPVEEVVAEGEEEDEEASVEESRKVKAKDAEAKALREELVIRDMIESAELKFAKPEQRKTFIKSLIPLTESERKELIESRKTPAASTSTQRPRSQGQGGVKQITESKEAKFPTTPEERKRLVSSPN